MKWLKMIPKMLTKKSRQNVARELLAEYLTPENISAWCADGANKLLANVNDKTKLNRIACKVNCVADLTADIAAAVRDGYISREETAQICARTQALAGELCTPEAIETIVEKAVALVP